MHASLHVLHTCRDTEQRITNTLGALYVATLFLGILNSIFVQPVVSDERAVFYRECAAGMYSVEPWYLAMVSPLLLNRVDSGSTHSPMLVIASTLLLVCTALSHCTLLRLFLFSMEVCACGMYVVCEQAAASSESNAPW